MGFKKLKSKNVFLSMILCSVTSFSLLYADNLKECQSKEDKKSECVEKVYDDNRILRTELPIKNGVLHGIGKHYYKSGDITREIQYTNDKINGIVRFY